MTKRVVASFLWAFAIYSGGELAWGLLGVPRIVGPVLGIAVASFVLLDPTGRIWLASPGRRIARIPDQTATVDPASATQPR
jgi:hypothetical protein